MRSLRTMIVGALVSLAFFARAQVTFTTMASADAFLCSGSPNSPELGGADLHGLNCGGAGTLVITPASSVKGELQSGMRFDLTD